MIDDDENILDVNMFIKLMKIAQDFHNFESHKTLFLDDFYLFLDKKQDIYRINVS